MKKKIIGSMNFHVDLIEISETIKLRNNDFNHSLILKELEV
jgi:hypothetical protein